MSSPLDSGAGTELFASYDSDFQLAYSEITQKLDDIPNLTTEQQKPAIKAAERAVEEAYEIVSRKPEVASPINPSL
ncbi:hypothetical protein AWJ20_2253 [Sugiyamaella lignohabitans]|uniref:Vesicle transport v-SNARE N-terminal domain-containing protein n=1 Tax=Sugiyamaella lignohabitans TaxID=796027 RepID=A0A167EZT3_9ASCO|nr:uncharacterized protein AWJ20_2253 [Sugiyamaella lignohabitans]ANB14648.1 hypothetical protein AWJ20_2253 [Sugiyamaella lignohabitans]